MAISILDALEVIYQEAKVVSSEIIPIESALDTVVAREYYATLNLPRFDNSAMDGYAIKCRDEGKRVICKDVIYAGDKALDSVSIGSAIKIMTGAPIPQGAEAVVPKENVRLKGEWVELPHPIKEGANIRYEGEDICMGDKILEKGETIKPYTIALLASQGISHIEVYRKIKVAIFSTGDELAHHYEQLQAAQLYNSNAPSFVARAASLGCETSYISSSGDSIESIQEAIARALHCDLIITSGGVSVGDKDFTKEAFKQMGMEVFFEKVDIKPGKPTTFGKLNSTYIVNLPGNPLASVVNFEMFIKPLIMHLQGRSECYHGVIESIVDKKCNIKGGKTSVLLGRYDGVHFYPLAKQSPGMVSPLHFADAMVVVAPEVSYLKHSQKVKMIPITLAHHASKKINFINH
ncbi:MAG: molybdopterin molybdotransferase MoeA [Campylobacterales bacterium]|nr:molybdopterin molybdotransferase MoeA [Campylobacterales bacterium]